MKVFQSAEQTGNVVTILTTGGDQVTALQSDLESFIEEQELNVRNEGSGLVCDPNSTDNDVEYCSAEQYLDDNFDAVCESYLRNNKVAA